MAGKRGATCSALRQWESDGRDLGAAYMLSGISEEDEEFLQNMLRGWDTTTYLSGSLAAGLGHSLSDIDVHALEPYPDAEDAVFAPSGRRVQVTGVTTIDLELFRQFAGGLQASPSNRGAFYLDQKSLWDLFRLASSRPLFVKPRDEWIFGEPLVDAIRQIQIGTRAHQVARAWSDASGLAASGELPTAIDIAKSASRDTMEMVLSAFGDYYSSPKLFLARAHRFATAWPASAWLEEFLDNPDCDIADTFRTLQTLGAHAQLRGWVAPCTSDAWVVSSRGGGNGGEYRRSLDYWLVRGTDSWSLATPSTRGFAVKHGMAVLWGCADAGDMDAIEAAYAELGDKRTTADLKVGLEKLVSMGCLEETRR